MKRLDEMDFNEISIEYNEMFNFIEKSILDKIKQEISNIYDEYIKYTKKDYKVKGGTFGRGELKWGRNIIWGWYVEKIIYEILKQNNNLKKITLYGGDKTHHFIYNDTDKKIEIEGMKETKPDFLLIDNNDNEFCIELKTAAREVFSIKKGNIEQLYKEAGNYNRITLILMIDLQNKVYSIENLKYFYQLKPFVNQRMEGQLCYNFPAPDKQLNLLQNMKFDTYIDNSIFDILEVKKIKALKVATELNNKEYIKLITAKIKLDKIEEEKQFQIEQFDFQIQNIIEKYSNVNVSWNTIFEKLNIK